MKHRFTAIAASACAIVLPAAASCGSAFCLVNTDWSVQGTWTDEGPRFDLRYESVDLDRPLAGRERVAVGQIARDHDEVETKNRNLVGTIDWGLSPDWGISLSVPYVDRDHHHIHAGETERWHFRELGDIRVQARRQLFATTDDPASIRTGGVTFGVKLPTGRFHVANADGEEAERTLQPGTGTTDLLLGAYWHSASPLTGWSWFTQAQAVVPMNSREGYKPGRQWHADGGVRYAVTNDVGVMLQVNGNARERDGGANAEPGDSGLRQVFVSPGVSWNFARKAQAYGFVQLPVYQAVNGVQLVADWSAAVGVSWRF